MISCFSWKALKDVEERINSQFKNFAEIDHEFLIHAGSLLDDYNSMTRHAARISAQASVRDSCRAMLQHADDALATLRNELYFRWSMLLGVLALVISLAAIAVDLWPSKP